ncbi:MAG TPA: hypothetical protein PLP50_00880 [Thermoanaerobaculia bacterium]|nr:hypothetical protein [Thermoanaerobaculia bacterium]HQN08687.1 hypothetical protein [Thermoanaerobaculia bacterium]HQP85070.1 hypothetical protein [Thermoanaerobaculia bacterium]
MNPLIISVSTAWEASGLSLAAFGDLVDALVSSGRAVRHRDLLVFPNLKTAALVLSGRPRRRARR